jgi:hypothetical protein
VIEKLHLMVRTQTYEYIVKAVKKRDRINKRITLKFVPIFTT